MNHKTISLIDCPACNGTGYNELPCYLCRGKGQVTPAISDSYVYDEAYFWEAHNRAIKSELEGLDD